MNPKLNTQTRSKEPEPKSEPAITDKRKLRRMRMKGDAR